MIATVAVLAAYGAHRFIVYRMDIELSAARAELISYVEQNTALQAAAAINIETIAGLESQFQQQSQQITTLTQQNNRISAERDAYLGIFREHDLTALSLARPGLIENRINSGTTEVFDQLEEDTKDANP